MKYHSTRDKSKLFNFRDVVFTGYCLDGGLFVPQEIPVIYNLEEWKNLSYLEILFKTLRIYIDSKELTDGELQGIISKSFSTFDTEEIIVTKHLRDGLTVAELFHGPSLAFKDHGISVLANMMECFCEKEDREIVVLVGTSGDTGGSAVESIKSLKRVKLIVLFPKGMCSEFQELQMTTCSSSNVRVVEVAGTSDDLDVPIKQCFLDPDLVKKYSLGSMNSVNWVRILVQAAHYIHLSMKDFSLVKPLTFVIPSGAAGNLAAGCIATKMGFPVRLVAAVNENDLIARFLTSGELSSGKVYTTHASAMDIQVPYNIERVLYFCIEDTDYVRKTMSAFLEGKAVVKQDFMEEIRKIISGSFKATDKEIEQALLKCWNDNQYLVCPHTAVSVAFIYSMEMSARDRLVSLATASPLKFGECILSLGLPVAEDSAIQKMRKMPKNFSKFGVESNYWHEMLLKLCDEISIEL